jgi:hypothetical protein
VATGNYTDSSGNYQALLLTGSGSSWTATTAPLPADAAADPEATIGSVTCPTASTCVAIGWYNDSSGNNQALLVTGSGSSWTATAAPLPAGAGPNSWLASVTCPSASACVATGNYTDSSGNNQALLVTGSGSSWTATTAPLPAGAGSGGGGAGLASVACPTASACVAIGGYTDASGDGQMLLETGSGSSWTATTAPLPAGAGSGANGPALASVACATASACVAIGWYTDASGDGQVLLETGSGSSWTAAEAPLPANDVPEPREVKGNEAPSAGLVVCPSTSSCVAIGSYKATPGQMEGMLLTGPA